MRILNGALAMGLIVAATTGLVATYAFAADDMAGSNPASNKAPAEVQAPADNGANAATPGVNGSSSSTANPSNTESPANTQNNAANSGNGAPDTDKASQATPSTPPADQSAQTQQTQQPEKKAHHLAMSRRGIETVQTALANSGQDVAIDGVWGPKTTEALKDFQKSHGLKATGHLDHKTREALPKST